MYSTHLEPMITLMKENVFDVIVMSLLFFWVNPWFQLQKEPTQNWISKSLNVTHMQSKDLGESLFSTCLSFLSWLPVIHSLTFQVVLFVFVACVRICLWLAGSWPWRRVGKESSATSCWTSKLRQLSAESSLLEALQCILLYCSEAVLECDGILKGHEEKQVRSMILLNDFQIQTST